MRKYLSMIPSCRGLMLPAFIAIPLFFAAPCRAEVATPFKITSFILQKDGKASLQWVGPNTNIVVQYTVSLTPPNWQPLPDVTWPVTGNNWTGMLPTNPGEGFVRVVTTGGAGTDGVSAAGGTAPIPMQTRSLSELMGEHDPKSAKFRRDCISCHGPRTQETALDGKTKAIHSTMLNFYGGGNDRCIKCHYNGPKFTGPNFLTQSAGSLRKQVNYEVSGCTSCHAKGGLEPLYSR